MLIFMPLNRKGSEFGHVNADVAQDLDRAAFDSKALADLGQSHKCPV
jgi:hypothetical protein